MRRLEATCTAADTHTRYGVQIIDLTLEQPLRAAAFPPGRLPGTPIIRLETESGQSDPPMLTQRTGLWILSAGR